MPPSAIQRSENERDLTGYSCTLALITSYNSQKYIEFSGAYGVVETYPFI